MFWTLLVGLITALPMLIHGVESAWKGVTGKHGPEKWIGVEQALSQSISLVATEVQKLAPAGTDADKLSGTIAVMTKAINDAIVTALNDLGIFKHGNTT